MALTRAEQETIINLPADADMAEVCSSDPIWIRRMDKLIERKPDKVKLVRRTEDVAWYQVPKNMVRINPPREMSAEQREAAAERFKEALAKRANPS